MTATASSAAPAFPPSRLGTWGAATLIALALVACGDKKDAKPQGAGAAAGAAAQPPEVGVVTVQPGTVSLTTELPGRLEASRVAQVRARATGILLKRVFTEGSDVRAGQVLYRIDSAPYEATRQSAEAQLAQAEAQLVNARGVAQRYKPLVAANAISRQEYEAAVAAEKAAQAQVAAARAGVRTAGISLDYATVTAPISGRIGRSLVTEGALVSATEGTQLATIQQINPLYLNITQSAGDVTRLREQLAAGKLARASGSEAASVQVLMENGQPYPQPARLLFTDLTVDPATGQVSLRAEVPNPAGMLLPGMYVRARIEQAQIDNAVLLPQQAVTRGTQGDTVMVVAPDGTFAPRPVRIGGQRDDQWIVTSGLKAGEQVLVEGVMKVMMGAKVVKPVPWQPKTPAAGASAGAGAMNSGAQTGAGTAAAAAPGAAPGTAGANPGATSGTNPGTAGTGAPGAAAAPAGAAPAAAPAAAAGSAPASR